MGTEHTPRIKRLRYVSQKELRANLQEPSEPWNGKDEAPESRQFEPWDGENEAVWMQEPNDGKK